MRRGEVGQEELAAVGSRARIRHGNDPGLVVLEDQFAGEAVARATRAVAERVSALGHEIALDPVEAEAIVESAQGQIGEIGHGGRRRAMVEFHPHDSFFGFDHREQVLRLRRRAEQHEWQQQTAAQVFEWIAHDGANDGG